MLSFRRQHADTVAESIIRRRQKPFSINRMPFSTSCHMYCTYRFAGQRRIPLQERSSPPHTRRGPGSSMNLQSSGAKKCPGFSSFRRSLHPLFPCQHESVLALKKEFGPCHVDSLEQCLKIFDDDTPHSSSWWTICEQGEQFWNCWVLWKGNSLKSYMQELTTPSWQVMCSDKLAGALEIQTMDTWLHQSLIFAISGKTIEREAFFPKHFFVVAFSMNVQWESAGLLQSSFADISAQHLFLHWSIIRISQN